MVWTLAGLPVGTYDLTIPAAANQAQAYYTVVKGDSLWAIAVRLGVTVEALKQANSLKGDLIFPNQVLVVPRTGGPSPGAAEPAGEEAVPAETGAADRTGAQTENAPGPSPAAAEYTVVAGDTLWTIAEKTGVSVAALKQANGIQNDFLAIGQVLRLPLPGAPVTQAPSRSGDRVQTILAYARTLEGHPYRWGGSTPGGFDCSGFTVHVFGRHGVELPRTSFDQFNAGTAVNRNELRPGDLVFFTTYRAGASHVGIYFGNGLFLHASSARGSVIWTDMNTHSYYSNRFLGGRRIVP